jgi:ribosomal protein S24E
MQPNPNHTNMRLVLSSLKDVLNELLSRREIQKVARHEPKVADIVEKTRVLRNLVETTAREMVENWKEG